jgi:predicted alternative tryptophan synthase beta-subunit
MMLHRHRARAALRWSGHPPGICCLERRGLVAIDLLTRDEAFVFAEKLERFGETLSATEKSLLLEILHRAAAAEADDVEGHGKVPTSIAAAVLAAAAAVGAAAVGTAATVSPTSAQTTSHSTVHTAHPGGQWVQDDKGGMEYIP